jgi:hypothetical protein
MTNQEQFIQFVIMLLASRRTAFPPVVGVTSGPGNQGTAAQMTIGQAGTAGSRIAVPRTLKLGAGGTAPGGVT